jgi:membrane protease YdiL (CAAX protease family)
LLIDGPRAPLPLAPGRRGWWFALCVLALLFLQSPLYMVVVVFGLAGFTMEAGRSVREQFGLGRLSLRVILTWSLLVWGAVVFVELPLSQAVDWVMTRVHVPHPEQLSVEMFRSYHRAAQIAGFMAQAVLLSPLVEELFFRGFLLTFLKNYTSTWPALILSAGVFAFAHVNLDSVLQLWLLGVVLGLAYEHTGSLLLPVGIHACWNLLTALNILLEKGGFG